MQAAVSTLQAIWLPSGEMTASTGRRRVCSAAMVTEVAMGQRQTCWATRRKLPPMIPAMAGSG